MKNKWKNIFANTAAEDLCEHISLKNVMVDEKNNCLTIDINSQKLLQFSQMQTIRQTLKNAFDPKIEIKTVFKFDEKNTQDMQQHQNLIKYLRQWILQKHPCFFPYINYIDFEHNQEDKLLNVCFPNEFAYNFWKGFDLSKNIEELFWSVFSKTIRINCEIVEKEIEFEIDLELENKRLAQQQSEKQKPTPQKQASATKQPKQEPTFVRKNFGSVLGKVDPNKIIYGKIPTTGNRVDIKELCEETGFAVIDGVIFKKEIREHKDGKKCTIKFGITDYTDSISCKLTVESEKTQEIFSAMTNNPAVRVFGATQIDKYSFNELIFRVRGVAQNKLSQRSDQAKEKRVELHLHTQMSTLDSMLSIKDAVEIAKRFGHSAMAVTDHGVVQSFPEFYSEAKKAGIKAIFGMEGYLVNDSFGIDVDTEEFIVFDLETTGLNEKQCQIIEIGAVKIRNNKICETFQSFANPNVPVPPKITELTGITTEMVRNAPPIKQVLQNFKTFAGENPLVAHNAPFDMKFLIEHANHNEIQFKNPYIDTLVLARYLLRDLQTHKLNDLTEHLKITLDDHHRADADAKATAQVFLNFVQRYKDLNLTQLPASFEQHRNFGVAKSKVPTYHIIFLVKDKIGLQNLYKLVTYAHLNHYLRRPRIPRSLLMMHSQGLIIGSACEAGELFQAILQEKSKQEIEQIANFYDYLEIQPIANNEFMIRKMLAKDNAKLQSINQSIFDLSKKLGKLCVATGDVHFKDPKDEYYRRVIMAGQGYSDADNQAPLYFKSTTEMLKEFSYLGEKNSYEVVVAAPNKIAEKCEMLQPFPFETCQPLIEGANEDLVECCFEKAHAIYGQKLPQEVSKRLDHELGAITKYGFAGLYIVARKLVIKSNEDGFLVGSRGSVGSSVAAYMAGITEVNALPPHYVCLKCKNSDFDIDQKKYSCGCDMPEKKCPVCGENYYKDGYTIPFETFLGFEGDKVPDIDLNFSGEYQGVAHKYTEEIFGKGFVFRAGTISGVQEKTAFGYAKKYYEERNMTARTAELERIATGCSGVKRTTGQHPGGIVVLPKDRSIFEFTPLQHPADEPNSPIITTHFDFRSMHDTLVKLDILGHVDPTIIKMMEDLTGLDAKQIPLDDAKTMSIFSSTAAIGVESSLLRSTVATYGIPEFGTAFVRQMLVDTTPTTMEELIRISGLSHGTDVWINNAQDLVRSGTASLSQTICTRDDIMNFLILRKMDKKQSFNIMESVRKGKGLTQQMQQDMEAADIQQWYIDSCKKIKYMFPRAHAAAYVMMAFRIAYFKVHKPLAFYAAYFSVRSDAFDFEMACGGANRVVLNIKSIEERGKFATEKEKSVLTILELVLEMNLRGFEIAKIDLMNSHATKFLIIDEKTLLPPLNSLAGLGTKAAQSIEASRNGEAYISIEDLQIRAKIGKATTDTLKKAGCLGDLPQSNQTTLF